VPYGSYKGILNFRHSEPYFLLKNMRDIVEEDHNIAIRWFKQAMKGGILGGYFGYMYFIGGPTGQFEMSKLFAAAGNRSFSGRSFR
jgi:hypothetical protein